MHITDTKVTNTGRVVRSFSAPRPVIEALNAEAAARGQTISAVVREALAAIGITPTSTP